MTEVLFALTREQVVGLELFRNVEDERIGSYCLLKERSE